MLDRARRGTTRAGFADRRRRAAHDPLTDRWSTLSPLGGPPAFPGWAFAMWTGSEMLVWEPYVTRTGGLYDRLYDRISLCGVSNELERGGKSANIAHNGILMSLCPRPPDRRDRIEKLGHHFI